jgi:hypothetical protein
MTEEVADVVFMAFDEMIQEVNDKSSNNSTYLSVNDNNEDELASDVNQNR